MRLSVQLLIWNYMAQSLSPAKRTGAHYPGLFVIPSSYHAGATAAGIRFSGFELFTLFTPITSRYPTIQISPIAGRMPVKV